MLQVGITGGIGSGKSTVCKIFQSLGIPIYDADTQAKKLMQENAQLVDAIKSEFGNDSYLASGAINRDYLAKVAFADSEKIKKLNTLVHPVVADDYAKWVSDQTADYVVKEAALLIESGSYLQLDKLIVVTAPTQLRIDRIKSRDSFRSEQEIEAIITNQLSDEERESKANFIIKNDESELLIEQVLGLDRQFRLE